MADPRAQTLPPSQYFNTLTIRNSAREFFFDFGQMAGASTGSDRFAHLIATLVTSPAHAKEIAATLQNAIERYEHTHGEIRDPKPRMQ